jgi:hypothetical protein
MDDPFNGAAEEKMAISVRQLGFENPSHTTTADCVGQSQRQDANDGREQVPE